MSKKILIIGNSAKEYALARKLSEKYEVYVAPETDTMSEFATVLDIREDSVAELLEFVVENGIDLTIPVSEKALSTNIVEIFEKKLQAIFAPSLDSVSLLLDKSYTKKTLYRLRIPTPRFGIFEKPNMAIDYIKNLKNPYVLKTNEASSSVILTSLKNAKNIVETAFAQKGQKIIIEDYISGLPFSFYVITDGYKALPIGSSLLYNHSLDGNGGQLTSGLGACVPNYKLSIENEYFIMDEVINPLLEYLENSKTPYIGVLGVKGILSDDNKINILGFTPFMQDSDASAILEILDADLVELMEACALGIFSDEINYIPLKDLSATTVVLRCNLKDDRENVINGLDGIDEDIIIDFYPQVKKNKYLELEARKGLVMNLTARSRTIASATQKLYDEIENVRYAGITYRKDVCKLCRV